jgi:hypothetical protein
MSFLETDFVDENIVVTNGNDLFNWRGFRAYGR